jgi:hypothetical protein
MEVFFVDGEGMGRGWRCIDGWEEGEEGAAHMIGWHYLTFYEPW